MSGQVNKDNEYELKNILFRQALTIPKGWQQEVYWNKDSEELTFSSLMTKNSWSDSKDKIGVIDSISISDFEAFYEIDDGEFVEVDDNGNEIDEKFTDKSYERYYKESSIITRDEAIDRILDNVLDDDIYQDICIRK